MAKIIDHTLLAQTTDVVFDTTLHTIQLLSTGAINIHDGVTGQAIYSFCKAQWKADPALIKFPFPLIAITEEKFELINGWDWADNATRALIRDAGWAVKDASNVSLEEWAGIITLGSFTDPLIDTAYIQQAIGAPATNLGHAGPVNEAVKIYGDATHGNFDYRNFFKIFLREQAELYDASDLTAIGVSTLTYQVYSFPLSNAIDLNITASDATIAASAPYTGMTITYLNGVGFTNYATGTVYAANSVVLDTATGRWFQTALGGTSNGANVAADIGVTDWTAYAGERLVDAGNYRAFDKVIGGTAGTLQQIYEFVEYQLRQATDIDAGAGTVIGNTADGLLHFVGSTLTTSTGVYIDNYQATESNSIEFHDVTGTARLLPFTAAGTIEFNTNLINDTAAQYWMFFTDPTATAGDEFGTAGAIIVNDAAGNPITGNVGGNASIAFDFDYDANIQGGRTAGTDAAVTVVALGLTTGQYVSASATITRSKANKISLVAALERNYV